MPRRSLVELWRQEFSSYTPGKFQQDLLAGLTVAAVALPLALAFGVASGATAASGLVTAILAGLVIGALSGAPYQISGPTGAMSAVLILLVQKYGLSGLWITGFFSGVLLLIIGLLRLGRLIAYIPAPVITGFTSGIALIIAIGQIDNLIGVKTAGADSAALKFGGYFRGGFTPDWHALVLGGLVIATMVLWPKKWQARVPSSLVGIILALIVNLIFNWPVATVGSIPQSLLLEDRLNFSTIPWDRLNEFIAPTLTITALGMIESLLCGAVASNMTGIRLQANQELIAQGLGNMLLPFFGGVPATAAIARTSVGIKSGGQTRLTSVIHALGLLASMFVLAPVMSRIPLAALAGVLMVTAWRMNEWESIQYIFSHRFKTAILSFGVTMIATITLDLTQAILIGVVISALFFLSQISQLQIEVQSVDPEKLRERGIEAGRHCEHTRVAYLTGPLFFAAVGHFNEAFAHLNGAKTLILSMRGVPFVDTSGLQALEQLCERAHKEGCTVRLAGVQPGVLTMLERGGLTERIGAERIHWSADQAIVAAA